MEGEVPYRTLISWDLIFAVFADATASAKLFNEKFLCHECAPIP